MMQDVTKKLHQKAVLHIRKNANTTGTVLDEALHFVYEYVCHRTGFNEDFSAFTSHGHFEDDTKRIKVNIASYSHTDDEATEQFRWAVRIRVPDQDHQKRLWVQHIGVHASSNDPSVHLFYAEFYSNNLFGSISSIPSPDMQCSQFIADIVQCRYFECTVGDYQLPHFPIQLDSKTIASFLTLLFAKKRSIPIVLAVCVQGIVDAYLMADVLTGNAIVFCVDEIPLIDSMSRHLPDALRVQEDGLLIYSTHNMNGDTRATAIPIDRLLRMDDPNAITHLLRRAYCEYMQPEERKYCHDFFDIMRRRADDNTHDLETRLSTCLAELDTLKTQAKNVKKKKEKNPKEEDDLQAYEELLDFSTKRLDGYRSQLREMALALYNDNEAHEILTGLPSNEDIAYLLEAIKHRDFMRGQRKKSS